MMEIYECVMTAPEIEEAVKKYALALEGVLGVGPVCDKIEAAGRAALLDLIQTAYNLGAESMC